MSQNEILKVIKLNPGIEQRLLCKQFNTNRQTIGEQIRALRRRGEIRREATENGVSWRLYPI